MVDKGRGRELAVADKGRGRELAVADKGRGRELAVADKGRGRELAVCPEVVSLPHWMAGAPCETCKLTRSGNTNTPTSACRHNTLH